MLSLEGLNPKDLNIIISDALCMFPRISEPLSDIIFQKTKGSPFFVLAFMRSLLDRGLLEYSINSRRWVWDEDDVAVISGISIHVVTLASIPIRLVSVSREAH
jgi:predicted ATPase